MGILRYYVVKYKHILNFSIQCMVKSSINVSINTSDYYLLLDTSTYLFICIYNVKKSLLLTSKTIKHNNCEKTDITLFNFILWNLN